jgi:hypothetical protein
MLYLGTTDSGGVRSRIHFLTFIPLLFPCFISPESWITKNKLNLQQDELKLEELFLEVLLMREWTWLDSFFKSLKLGSWAFRTGCDILLGAVRGDGLWKKEPLTLDVIESQFYKYSIEVSCAEYLPFAFLGAWPITLQLRRVICLD